MKKKVSSKHAEAAKWFEGVCLECFTNPLAFSHKRATKNDVIMWSKFLDRMREIKSQHDLPFQEYDLVKRRDAESGWFFSATAVYLIVDANIDTLRRVGAFERLTDAHQISKAYIRRHHGIEDSRQLTAEQKMEMGKEAYNNYMVQLRAL